MLAVELDVVGPYVRTVNTASGAQAEQVIHVEHCDSKNLMHGRFSAHYRESRTAAGEGCHQRIQQATTATLHYRRHRTLAPPPMSDPAPIVAVPDPEQPSKS